MDSPGNLNWPKRLRNLLFGQARNLSDSQLFHKMTLVAFFAWVGLGADGLSSSCYGPQEAFMALGAHTYLALFVALASAITVFVISASYSQIIEQFPTGGGGYLVATKLLSPALGMVSGSALLIDYVLTITVSIASGADAVFSFLPDAWYPYRLLLAAGGVILLTALNVRGVKESVVPLVPIFLIFLVTHAFAILYGLAVHAPQLGAIIHGTLADTHQARAQLGLVGMGLLMLRAYSMGAGTYTGIEAVSNGLPILRDPKVQTAKRTMRYMAVSLAFMVFGLMLAYLLFGSRVGPHQTINAVLFGQLTAGWAPGLGVPLVLIALISEAAILFVAAQAGFLDAPRVLAYMARDYWVPSRFALLSDRLVTKNGILIIGGSALAIMFLTQGSVALLVILYSINVFITFVLSQLGMVRHWWQERAHERAWVRKLLVNGLGLGLTGFILVSVVVLKFNEGGWITLLATGALITAVVLIRRHYQRTQFLLRRLDSLVAAAEHRGNGEPAAPSCKEPPPPMDPKAKTAVILVNGFNGLGLHTTLNVIRLFGETLRNYVFVEVGVVDASVLKDPEEIDLLRRQVETHLGKYVDFMTRHGLCTESFSAIGTEVVAEVVKLMPAIQARFPQAIFFGGQLVFPRDSVWNRWLHNYTVYALQRNFYFQGIPMVILPIRAEI